MHARQHGVVRRLGLALLDGRQLGRQAFVQPAVLGVHRKAVPRRRSGST